MLLHVGLTGNSERKGISSAENGTWLLLAFLPKTSLPKAGSRQDDQEGERSVLSAPTAEDKIGDGWEGDPDRPSPFSGVCRMLAR